MPTPASIDALAVSEALAHVNAPACHGENDYACAQYIRDDVKRLPFRDFARATAKSLIDVVCADDDGCGPVLVSPPDEHRGDWRAPRRSQVITSGASWRAAEWESHREIFARKPGVLDSKRGRWAASC